jgi:hypothetical protein
MQVNEGDMLYGLCCPRYTFTVNLIIYSVFGHCDGPHPGDEKDPYRQVSVFDTEDIELFLSEQTELDITYQAERG